MKKLFRNRKNKADKNTGEVVQQELPVPQESHGRAPSNRAPPPAVTSYQQRPPPQQQYSQRQQQQQPPQYQQAPPPRTQTTTTVRNIPAPSTTTVRHDPPPVSPPTQEIPVVNSPPVRESPPPQINIVREAPAPAAPAAPVSMPQSSGRSRQPPPAMGQSVSHVPANDASATREVVKKFIADIWNRGDLDLIPEVCHRSLRFNGSVGMDRVGHDGFARMVQTIRDALSDYHCEIHSMVVEGNKAFVRMRFTGRHTGALLGFEPTGRQVAWMGASEFTIKDGKILKVWELGDVKSLEQQLYPEDEM